MVARGRKKGGRLGCWGRHSTLLCLQWITNKDPLYSTGTPAQVTWQPGWEGSWGRVDTCVCVAESLHCPPKAVTVLLTGYIPRAEEPGFCPRVTEELGST